jgi:ankyrin repeat protein
MFVLLADEIKMNLEHRELQERSPLYYAANVGETRILKYLIEKGCDVNA